MKSALTTNCKLMNARVLIIFVLGIHWLMNVCHFSEAFATLTPLIGKEMATENQRSFSKRDNFTRRYRHNIIHMGNQNHNSEKLQNENLSMDEIISQGEQAAENWDMYATPFMNYHDTNLVKSFLDNRADVQYMEIGNIATSSSFDSIEVTQRTRILITNPDLELDLKYVEKEYCNMIRIDSIHSITNMPEATNKSKPWPSLFMKIGVDVENIGEVIIEEDTGHIYITVLPAVVKQCIRLLPKVLKGVGISVSEVGIGEYLPYDGKHQDMELGVLDMRSLKYT